MPARELVKGVSMGTVQEIHHIVTGMGESSRPPVEGALCIWCKNLLESTLEASDHSESSHAPFSVFMMNFMKERVLPKL